VADREALTASALRDVLQAMDIRGLLTLPLMNGDACLGFVGLATLPDSADHMTSTGHPQCLNQPIASWTVIRSSAAAMAS